MRWDSSLRRALVGQRRRGSRSSRRKGSNDLLYHSWLATWSPAMKCSRTSRVLMYRIVSAGRRARVVAAPVTADLAVDVRCDDRGAITPRTEAVGSVRRTTQNEIGCHQGAGKGPPAETQERTSEERRERVCSSSRGVSRRRTRPTWNEEVDHVDGLAHARERPPRSSVWANVFSEDLRLDGCALG